MYSAFNSYNIKRIYLRIKQFVVSLILLLMKGLTYTVRGIWWLFLILTKPFVWIAKGVFKLFIFPLYSLFSKTRFRIKAVYQQRQQLYQNYARYTSYVAIVLLVVMTAWQGVQAQNATPENFGRNTLVHSLTQSDQDFIENEEIVEGPITQQQKTVESYIKQEALSEQDYIIEPDLPVSWQDSYAIMSPDESAVSAPDINDTSLAQTRRDEIIEYEVQPGDVLGAIAEKYDLNLATLLWANDLSAYSIIRPGKTLKILPTDGLIYEVESGDTLSSIAKKYQSDVNDILEANKLASANQIQPGQELMLPGGIKPTTIKRQTQTRSLASVFTPPQKEEPAPAAEDRGGAYLWPTNSRRITQYYGWRHSGVDVGNKTGQPIYAAETGKVETAGWNNGGYGYYVIINHGNGVKTLYAHASKLHVGVGDSVSRGDIIADIGSTGWSTGPHIHFEVRVNGSRANPLSYIK